MTKKIRRENCQVGIWQKCYTDRTTRGLMKNIGDNWKEIGGNGREKKREDQKELMKKKRKKKLKKKEQENEIKKMQWEKQEMNTMSCEFSGQKFLRGGYCHKLMQL